MGLTGKSVYHWQLTSHSFTWLEEGYGKGDSKVMSLGKRNDVIQTT